MTTKAIDPGVAEYLARPLAMRPDALAHVASMTPRAGGAESFAARETGYRVFGRVAHLPVTGPMCFGGGLFCWLFGMCDTEHLADCMHAAAEDPAVDTVLLEIDSPGGDVAGMSDLVAACDAVKAAGVRLVAAVHDRAFSGAYWLASQADELCVTETSECGSIGAFRLMFDSSAMHEKLGLRAVLVASTPLKAPGLPGVEITEPQVAAAGDPVARMHAAFVADVAEGRGVEPAAVQGWAESPDAFGVVAVERGMADRVVTFRGLLEELASPVAIGAHTMTDTKSAAAVKRAADKAAAKAEDDKPSYEDLEARVAEMEEEKKQLADENASLKAQIDEMGDTDEGETAEDPKAKAAARAEAQSQALSIGRYKQAFAAADLKIDDEARAYITEAMEDETPPAAAAKAYARILQRGRRPDAGGEGDSTDALASRGPGEPGTYDEAVDYLVKHEGVKKTDAFVQAAKRWPKLHKAYLNGQGAADDD